MKLQANTILINRYQILDSIGQGGFGITYLAAETQLEIDVLKKDLKITLRAFCTYEQGRQ
jgi:serine/threonine protein kinase